MNIGEKIRVSRSGVYIQPDKTVSKATVNIQMANVGVLFQNASIHQTTDTGISLANVCDLLTAKRYVHIRKTANGEFFGVFIENADVADFCNSMGLRAVPKKKDGTTQYQLNVGKLPKIGSKAYWKWAKYGEVVNLTDWVNDKILKKPEHSTVNQAVKRKKTGYLERAGLK